MLDDCIPGAVRTGHGTHGYLGVWNKMGGGNEEEGSSHKKKTDKEARFSEQEDQPEEMRADEVFLGPPGPRRIISRD